MSEHRELRVDVLDLLRQPGSRRDLTLGIRVDGLESGLVTVPSDGRVTGELALESLSDSIVAHGRVSVPWAADCSRCLERYHASTDVAVDELFEPEPVEGETYPLDGHELDLEQMLRDVLVVEFPLAPAPPAPDGRCEQCDKSLDEFAPPEEEPTTDPRWAILDTLDL